MSSATTTENDLLEESQAAVARAREAGADDAVASFSTGRSVEYVYRDGQVEKVQESTSKRLTVELYADGRYSAHATSDLRPGPLGKFLADAVALTRVLEVDPHRVIPDPALYEGRADVDLDLVDPSIATMDRDQCLALLGEMDTAAHGDPAVISAASHLQFSSSESARASSNGFAGVDRRTAIVNMCEVTIADGEKRPEAYAYGYAAHRDGIPGAAELGELTLERALGRRGSGKGDSVRTKVVIEREAAASLLGRVFGALTGGAIQQKRSFLADKLGERVASSILSITDDPHLVRGLGSSLFDDEGISTRPRPVLEDGVLRTYFVDTYYGRKLGWDPTTGSPSNLVVACGDKDLDGLLAEVGDGVLVTDWAGGNADLTTGDFSFGMRGNLIEGGAVGRPLSEMNVTGNYGDLLERIVALGSDAYPYSTLRMPSAVFDGVQVSGL